MTQVATTPAVTNGNKPISSTSARAKAIIDKANAKQATAPLINSNEVRTSNKEVITQQIAKEQAKPTVKHLSGKPLLKVKDAIDAATVEDLVEAMKAGEVKAKPEVKDIFPEIAKAKPATKPATKPASKPISKMTIKELESIKGTIADVQWNKYFKMAGGVSGITTKKADKPVKAAKPVKEVKAAKEAKEPMFTCSEAMGIIMKKNSNGKATIEQIINAADTLYIKKSGKESNIPQMSKYYSFAIHFQKGFNAK